MIALECARFCILPRCALCQCLFLLQDYFSFYIGQLCATIALMICPEAIVLGGGVMQRKSLFPKIRKVCQEQLNGYLSFKKITEGLLFVCSHATCFHNVPACTTNRIFAGTHMRLHVNFKKLHTMCVFLPCDILKIPQSRM